jgi:hypothetical protein
VTRALAILTILFLTSSTLYSTGWYCILVSGECCVTGSEESCPKPASPKFSRACASPCGRESKPVERTSPCDGGCGHRAGTEDVADCGAAAPVGCIVKIVVQVAPVCKSIRPTGRPDFSTACSRPDNTRCARQTGFPQECEPIQCIIARPLLAAAPPKAPSPGEAPALRLLDAQLWVEPPPVNPTPSPPWAAAPIIETTVLRI